MFLLAFNVKKWGAAAPPNLGLREDTLWVKCKEVWCKKTTDKGGTGAFCQHCSAWRCLVLMLSVKNSLALCQERETAGRHPKLESLPGLGLGLL